MCRSIAVLKLLVFLFGFFYSLTTTLLGFPDRPVKVIVPFSPGGGSDTFARIMLRSLNSAGVSAEPWVVVNIPGAGGSIGSRRVLNAEPDGHTILFLHDGIVTARYSGLTAFGPEAFEPIAGTGSLGAVICVGEDSEYTSLSQLLDYAAENPDTVTFAANIGAPSWFMARLIQHAHGSAAFRFVQSGGGARRFSDLKGNHVSASAFSVAEFLNFESGGLRALAYLGAERHPALPNVPTAKENGYDVEYENLQAWWAPKGTPASIVDELSGMLQEAMESDEFKAELAKLQIDPAFLNGSELEIDMSLRAGRIEELGLVQPSTDLPRLEFVFIVVAALGGLLAICSIRRFPHFSQRGWITDQTLLSRAGIATGLVATYLLLIQFTEIPFEALTFGFVFLITIAIVGRARITRIVLTSIAVPGLCYFLLHRLLGLELP